METTKFSPFLNFFFDVSVKINGAQKITFIKKGIQEQGVIGL